MTMKTMTMKKMTKTKMITRLMKKKRLTKTALWQCYFQLNWLKAWVFMLRCAVSTGKYEHEFYEHMMDLWKGGEGL